jgi:localization factor PodJL
MRWWRKAAEQGHAEAQLNLGLGYAIGEVVPQNYVEAHTWVNLAASRVSAPKDRERAVQARSLIASQMTSTQIAEAQRRASEWQPKVVESVPRRRPRVVESVPRRPPKAAEPVLRPPSSARDLILRVQEHLHALGYQPGPRDGILGPRTRAALRQYQADRGLTVTGNLDTATQQAMDIRDQGHEDGPDAARR